MLLATQWLVAAYACPAVAIPVSAAGAAVIAQPVMPDCHGVTPAVMDSERPSLCKAHCDADQQVPAQWSPDDAPAPSSGWFIVPAPGLLDLTGAQPGQMAASRSRAPPGWPPLYLIHGVLRN
jgi:hypothetical protein